VIVVSTAGLQGLKELHLDRTLVTDDGAATVKGTTFVFHDKSFDIITITRY